MKTCNYIVHTAIKGSDGNVRRLSYDLTEQTEDSVQEFARVFTEIEKRFPDTQFWIDRYPEKSTDSFIRIHGDKILDSLKVENVMHQIDDTMSPSDLGVEY